MVTEEQEQQQEKHLSASFKIDIEGLAAQGRSLQALLLHRRCASCWGTLIQEPAQGMNIEVAEHLEQIAHHCSAAPDFIHPELPVMEAVFRILLSNGNEPMTVESIYETLQERWMDSTNPRTPPPEKLYRLLSGDMFYGIREVSETAEGEASYGSSRGGLFLSTTSGAAIEGVTVTGGMDFFFSFFDFLGSRWRKSLLPMANLLAPGFHPYPV